MARIYKRVRKGQSAWWIDYHWPPGRGGQRIREKVGPVKDEARILLARRLEDIRQGCDPTLRRIRPKAFSEICAEFMTRHVAAKKLRSADTIKRHVAALRKVFDGKTLQEITPRAIAQYVAERCLTVSGSTANRERSQLSNIFNRAKEWGYYAAESPVQAVKPYKEPKGRLRFLSPQDEAILRAKAAKHLEPYIFIGCRTGGRDAELRGLKWDDVDLEQGLIIFDARNTKSGLQREVPMSVELLAYMKARHKSRPRWGAGGEYVLSLLQEPLTYPRTAFDGACRRACLGDDVTPHTLRHTFASWFMQNGGDLYRLQKLLGHSDIKLTQRYAHLSASWLQDGAAFIGPPKENQIGEAAR